MSEKYTVGQELIALERTWKDGKATTGPVAYTITRLGRLYGYVARNGRGREVQFHLDTGIEKTQYGGATRFWTREEYADREAQSKDVARLHALVLALPGLGPSPYRTDFEWFGKLSPETRSAMLDMMEKDNA